MSCQKFVSSQRTLYGTGLSVVSGNSFCQSLGVSRMLIASCWEPGSDPGSQYAGWCLANSETYEILAAADSSCLACVPQTASQPHDLFNGSCVPASTLGTTGLYPNLAACEAAKSNGAGVANCNCGDLDGRMRSLENREQARDTKLASADKNALEQLKDFLGLGGLRPGELAEIDGRSKQALDIAQRAYGEIIKVEQVLPIIDRTAKEANQTANRAF